jgi:toluene monooxygenase system ferredoxin subunit
MAFVKAADEDALWSGEMLGLSVAGRKVLLVNHEGVVYAYEDRCAHLGIPLSKGKLRCEVLTCSAHEWQYDIRSGLGLNPRQVALKALRVEVRDGGIWVDVEGAPAASAPR